MDMLWNLKQNHTHLPNSSSIIVILCFLRSVSAISLPSFEKSSATFAGSKHRSYLSLNFVFVKVPLNMPFNFLTLFTWFSCKKNKNAYFWALGPLGPRGPNRRFFYKKGVLLFLSFFMVEKFSASYFKMPGLWTLYSINLISHGPPWRRVDHTVTLLTSVTSVTSVRQSRHPSIYLGARK